MPTKQRYLDSDMVTVYETGPDGKKQRLATLLWGDVVKVIGKSGDYWKLDFTTRRWDAAKKRYVWDKHDAFISGKTKFRDGPLLKVRFVDVGQGDGAIVESPRGQIVLIDGGEEDHLYNYFTAGWAHLLRNKAVELAAIVVTHGDADHFGGLTRLVDGWGPKGSPPVATSRVFHNGLVKRPGGTKDLLGKTVKKDGVTYVTDLHDNLLNTPDKQLNKPVLAWKSALIKLKHATSGFSIRRLAYGDDAAFDFLRTEDIDVQVLGPIVEKVNGKNALRFLKTPGSSSLPASHTINGHSIVLRLTYGNVRMLFGADLNDESEQALLKRARADGISLTSEVLKVPHHGSADFSASILDAIRPVVSVISSGDESGAKEYIHPRAGLVGALGKYSRGTVERPLIYVTEMVAFFRKHGLATVQKLSASTRKPSGKAFDVRNAYEKTSFGIVHIRTDGERVLVATHSGRQDKKEAYAFWVDENGAVEFEDVPRIL
ncbi:MAG: ComEC/Rec2 family competence protein [Gemmatimonadota bacterium]